MNLTLYGESRDGVDIPNTKLLNFVYLHGELNNRNQYDLVSYPSDDASWLKRSGIFGVDVVLSDGNIYKANAYLWFDNKMNQQHGLVVAIDDVKYNIDARIKYKQRRWCVSGIATENEDMFATA